MSPESLTVLGSGVVGFSVAREARLRGIPVQLLEARELGAGCTPSATGVLKAPEHRRSPYLDLRHLSWEDWPLLAKSLYEESEGLEVRFSLCGGLDLRDRTMKDPQQAIEKLYGSGGTVRVVPEAELKSTLPRVRRPLGDAVFIEH
ncbi:MAG: FAD-dependent oxidoreductase, partial [Planctomycetia bacterium]|nr:FAD-dependent oxidoreductase [Planctomycetia bacterium]